MSTTLRKLSCALTVLAASLPGMAGTAYPAVADGKVPIVVRMDDDDFTRGDWLGAYGSQSYVLCAMRAPRSLAGGSGGAWNVRVTTGNPQETPRAWRSSAPAIQDRSVLADPSGLRRTQSVWDDHGETYPIGKGPDLHLHIPVPDRLCVLSLYFFEVDWPQYRAYRISIRNEDEDVRPVAQARADNFLKGKYVRFAVLGPANLLAVIARGSSPNAVVSGIFLDDLPCPGTVLLDMAFPASGEAAGAPSAGPPGAGSEQSAAAALEGYASVRDEAALRRYLSAERAFLMDRARLHHDDPARYVTTLEEACRGAHERAQKARSLQTEVGPSVALALMEYQIARAAFDLEEAQSALRAAADELRARARTDVAELDMLDRLARPLLTDGRRAEASIVIDAFVQACLAQLPAQEARQRLTAMAARALPASVTAALATGLQTWEARNGALQGEDVLLLANLLYVAARHAEAAEAYRRAEKEIPGPTRHQWILVAEMTAFLRAGKDAEAMETFGRMEILYPGTGALDEAKFRIGVHHFDRGDWDRAQEAFEKLHRECVAAGYRPMCVQYMERITHERRGGVRPPP